MKALIFNSGQGTRMKDATKKMPKCMTAIGRGFTILSWQLKALKQIDPDEVIITTGPFEDAVKNHVSSLDYCLPIRYVQNPLFKETNYIYSFYCAKDFLTDDTIIMHGDLVFEQSVLHEIANAKQSVVVTDSTAEMTGKDFAAIVDKQRVKTIGVNVSGKQAVACQPMYKMIEKDLKLWLDEIENYCTRLDKRKVYAEDAFNEKSDDIELYAIDIKGRLCQEVDDLPDLEDVKNKFVRYLQKDEVE